jgi:hypothetical protein
MSHLTIAYFTSRKQPMIEWFFGSLERETGGDYSGIGLVIVDFYAFDRFGEGDRDKLPEFDSYLAKFNGPIRYTKPKSTVWQGKHRRTKVDWFAAANARNTAICLAPDGWIAFVDDLSVLLPGWLTRVREAMKGPQNRITCGAYRKVRDLVVKDGEVISYTDNPPGNDNRLAHVKGDGPHECGSNWLYGCSLAAPVEAFLVINGFPEALCDGMGFEDVIAGIMLGKKGYSFVYDPRMMTFESEELHAQLPVMKRSDYGVSPNDKSHAILNIAVTGDGWHPNYFGEEGIRGLRQRVLAGEPFPICGVPEHEWYSKTRLEDL